MWCNLFFCFSDVTWSIFWYGELLFCWFGVTDRLYIVLIVCILFCDIHHHFQRVNCCLVISSNCSNLWNSFLKAGDRHFSTCVDGNHRKTTRLLSDIAWETITYNAWLLLVLLRSTMTHSSDWPWFLLIVNAYAGIIGSWDLLLEVHLATLIMTHCEWHYIISQKQGDKLVGGIISSIMNFVWFFYVENIYVLTFPTCHWKQSYHIHLREWARSAQRAISI
jgi:hypothetical protein